MLVMMIPLIACTWVSFQPTTVQLGPPLCCPTKWKLVMAFVWSSCQRYARQHVPISFDEPTTIIFTVCVDGNGTMGTPESVEASGEDEPAAPVVPAAPIAPAAPV